ncbi:MAG: hypothetical protein ACXVRH_02135 [Thermoleophilaceae bacterium]
MSGQDGQRPEALRAVEEASRLFERLIDEVANRTPPRLRLDEALRGLEDGGAAPAAELRAGMVRTIDLYSDLLRATVEMYADVLGRTLGTNGTATAGGSPVSLTGVPGQRAAGQVWLHNGTESSLTAVRLRVTDLATPDGATLAGAHGSFSPVAIDVAPEASASATLTVDLPPEAAAGSYHGLVLSPSLPDASIPVLLVVA